MREEAVAKHKTEWNKTHLANWKQLSHPTSCNCPLNYPPTTLITCPWRTDIGNTGIFFNEHTNEKCNQWTQPTQRESSAFTSVTFEYFLTATVCTEPTLIQVIYVSRHFRDQPEQIAPKHLNAHHTISKQFKIQDWLLWIINATSKH